ESIPNIFLPEVNIENKNFKDINFSWFLEQVNLINENFQWYDLNVQKISWTKPLGFIVKFESKENLDLDKKINENLLVYLGHNDLEFKTEKFKALSMILKQKNINPSRIDLNLTDRIFIK